MPAPQPSPQPAPVNEEFQRLIGYRHHDPHAILGVHPGEHGALFRCFRPDAVAVEALAAGEKAVPLRQTAPGVWEAELPYAQHGPGISVRAKYPDGAVWESIDPYSFLPTLGQMDLYL